MTIVLQKASGGRFASELLKGRYQVMESAFHDFYIYDHIKDDLIRERNGMMAQFASIKDAAVRIGFCGKMKSVGG